MGFTTLACMSFDHRENLLWVVDKAVSSKVCSVTFCPQGHVCSYYRAALQVYSRFFWPGDREDEVAHSILPMPEHVLIVGQFTVAAYTRGGVPVYFYRYVDKTVSPFHFHF